MVAGKKVAVDPEAVKQFAGLASDSRDVQEGFLFAAIPGTKGDGVAFVGDAVGRGAVADAATAARLSPRPPAWLPVGSLKTPKSSTSSSRRRRDSTRRL